MAKDTYICPSCGSEVVVGSPCPGCKPPKARRPLKRRKPERKPWQTDGSTDGLDLPEEAFDYEDFVAREFGGAPHRQVGIKWYWWLTALLLLVGLAVLVLPGLF